MKKKKLIAIFPTEDLLGSSKEKPCRNPSSSLLHKISLTVRLLLLFLFAIMHERWSRNNKYSLRYSFTWCRLHLPIGGRKRSQPCTRAHSGLVADSVADSWMILSWKAPAPGSKCLVCLSLQHASTSQDYAISSTKRTGRRCITPSWSLHTWQIISKTGHASCTCSIYPECLPDAFIKGSEQCLRNMLFSRILASALPGGPGQLKICNRRLGEHGLHS